MGITLDAQKSARIKEFLTTIIKAQSSKLLAVVLERQPFKGSGPFGTNVSDEFGAVLNRTRRDVEVEVDLWLAALNQDQRSAGTTQVNVAGDVGIVQTGDYASASQAIVLDGEGKDAIARALEQVAQGLEETPGGQFNVNDIKELVRECQDELVKGEPNHTKLKASLVGIATAIQTSAALGPAYQALKGALGFLGITLP